jgi:alpha-D-ribose 1-methylphosphonate 5-triphosphate synthase subunit PhnI
LPLLSHFHLGTIKLGKRVHANGSISRYELAAVAVTPAAVTATATIFTRDYLTAETSPVAMTTPVMAKTAMKANVTMKKKNR